MSDPNTQTGREKILSACFDELYHKGYQGLRIDTILEKTSLAKGALYHHFPNKMSLAYAVIEEIIYPHLESHLNRFFVEGAHPLTAIKGFFIDITDNATDEEVSLGCPINKLAQEMSGLDEGFNERLCRVYTLWVDTISNALTEGKESGLIKPHIDSMVTAMFILSSFQGIVGSAKCLQSKEALCNMTQVLCDYVDSLGINN